MEEIEISFIIPAYNEGSHIVDTLGAIDAVIHNKNLPYEIVVVDDGSVDRTYLNAVRYANKNGHVKVLSYPKNMGKGYAVKTGFLNANGNIVFFTDGDMEIALKNISDYVKALEDGDIVIASKKHKNSHVQVPLSRKILSQCFNALVRLLTGIPLKDTQSGLKAMRKSAFTNIVPRLAVKRYAFDVELLAVANLYGLKIVELPVNINLEAKFKPKEIWHMLIDLLGIAYRLRIIHWYQRSSPLKNNLQNAVAIFLRESG
jgi:glycosyltransferase involved in cell wall biosynthesis